MGSLQLEPHASSPQTGIRRMMVAQAIVAYLANQFIEIDDKLQRICGGGFGIFGHGNAPALGEVLNDARAELPLYRGQNEQSMGFAAAAYAKAQLRRRFMFCIASAGPGTANLLTAAALAHANRLPILMLCGDNFAKHLSQPLVCDARTGLAALNSALGQDRASTDWLDLAQAERQKWNAYVAHNVAPRNGLPGHAQAIGAVNALCMPQDRGVSAADCLPAEMTAHARAMGTIAKDVASVDEFGAAFARAKRADRTSVIVMKVDAHEGWTDQGHAWQEVGIREVSTRGTIGTARAKIEAGRANQRRGL